MIFLRNRCRQRLQQHRRLKKIEIFEIKIKETRMFIKIIYYNF